MNQLRKKPVIIHFIWRFSILNCGLSLKHLQSHNLQTSCITGIFYKPAYVNICFTERSVNRRENIWIFRFTKFSRFSKLCITLYLYNSSFSLLLTLFYTFYIIHSMWLFLTQNLAVIYKNVPVQQEVKGSECCVHRRQCKCKIPVDGIFCFW